MRKFVRIFDDDGDDKISLEEWRAISEITKKVDCRAQKVECRAFGEMS